YRQRRAGGIPAGFRIRWRLRCHTKGIFVRYASIDKYIMEICRNPFTGKRRNVKVITKGDPAKMPGLSNIEFKEQEDEELL
ncbi:MAG: hypothetical protein PHC80_03400, partial [Eubacteriales bacterium]|nr:hypothetical protein [Eubacteriales bacterium]